MNKYYIWGKYEVKGEDYNVWGYRIKGEDYSVWGYKMKGEDYNIWDKWVND